MLCITLAHTFAVVVAFSPQTGVACRPGARTALRRVRGGEAAAHIAQALAVYAPSAGVLTSNALYFASLPGVLAARHEGRLGAFNPLPPTLVVLSAFAWLGYGLSSGNPFIVASNLPGVAGALTALMMMLPLMQDDPALPMVQGTLVGGVVANLGLWSYLVLSGASAAVRSRTIGLFASSLFIVMAASPLSTIRAVVASRSAASIDLRLTMAQCANCLLWCAYGAGAVRDVFVWGPNAIGLGLGLAQLLLKLAFPSVK